MSQARDTCLDFNTLQLYS